MDFQRAAWGLSSAARRSVQDGWSVARPKTGAKSAIRGAIRDAQRLAVRVAGPQSPSHAKGVGRQFLIALEGHPAEAGRVPLRPGPLVLQEVMADFVAEKQREPVGLALHDAAQEPGGDLDEGHPLALLLLDPGKGIGVIRGGDSSSGGHDTSSSGLEMAASRPRTSSTSAVSAAVGGAGSAAFVPVATSRAAITTALDFQIIAGIASGPGYAPRDERPSAPNLPEAHRSCLLTGEAPAAADWA